ncbi:MULTISPECIES: hypothetical protein [Bacteria]
MGEILHLGALAPAAVGACCIAADRRRARTPELAASVLMLVAMLDVVLWGVVAPVAWAGVLIVAAIALAALRGRTARSRAAARVPVSAAGVPISGTRVPVSGARVPSAVMTVHATLGLVVMATLVLAMIPDASAPAVTVGHHASGAPFGLLAAASALLFGLVSAVAARAPHDGGARVSALERGQLIAMGASTAAMGMALFA